MTYVERLEKAIVEARDKGAFGTGGIYRVNVMHDDDCPVSWEIN